VGAAEDALAAARLWAVTEQPYLSAVLFAMTPVVRPGLATFGVDRRWRLYYDPACFERWSTEEVGSVLIHEAGHLLRDHAGRAGVLAVGSQHRDRFNAAADLEINDDLLDLSLPTGGLQPVGFDLPVGELAETYYAALGAMYKRPAGSWCVGGSGVDGLPADWEEPGGSDISAVRPGEGDLIRQQVATEVRRIVNAGGHLPDGVVRWAEAFLHPRIDWRRRLGGALRGALGSVSGAVDYRYGRPSRRTGSPIGRDVVFPRLVQPVPRVAVVVDTSASMDAGLLERVLGEVRGILRSAGVSGQATAVMSCDTAVRATQRVFSLHDVRLEGGGGTFLGAGLDAAAQLRPPCDVVIVLTDGFTPWPEHRPGRARTIVGVVGEKQGTEPAWAEVIEIPE
jgi:predicted metal-dependent peptidase